MGLVTLTFEWDGNIEGKTRDPDDPFDTGHAGSLYKISDIPADLNGLTKIEVSPSAFGGGMVVKEVNGCQYLVGAHPVIPDRLIGPVYARSSPDGLYIYGSADYSTNYCDKWVSLIEITMDEADLPSETEPVSFLRFKCGLAYPYLPKNLLGWKLAQKQ